MGLMKIALIVDDQEAEIRLMTSILKKIGYEVVSATDVNKATQLLHEWSPHLMVVDISVGQDDGIEWLQTVKIGHYKHVLTVVMTGSPEPVDVLRAAKVGIDGYILKPSDQKTISEKLSEVSDKIEKLPLYTMSVKDKKGLISSGTVTVQLSAISETGLILSGDVYDFGTAREIEVSGVILKTIGLGEKVRVTTSKTDDEPYHKRLGAKNRIYCKGVAWAANSRMAVIDWIKSQNQSLQRVA